MSKQDELNKIIKELRENVPDITGIIVASDEGLSIATDFHDDEAIRIAAVSAAASGLAGRISGNASLGETDEVMIKGKDGLFLIYMAGERGVLAVRAPARGNLGLVRLEASGSARQVERILNL